MREGTDRRQRYLEGHGHCGVTPAGKGKLKEQEGRLLEWGELDGEIYMGFQLPCAKL